MGRRLAYTVLTAALLLGACSDDEPKTEVYGEGDEAVQIGGDTPEDFPDDIPLPDGAAFQSGGMDAGYFFDVAATSEEIVAFYDDELPGFQVEASGDEMVDEAALEMGVIITWDGGEITFSAPSTLLIRVAA